MQKITKAILAVMKDVKSIDKDSTIGTGKNQYKGVSDKHVKQIIGQSMQKNGLIIIPTSIESKANTERWDQTSTWNNKETTKTKQQTFTEVKTKYMLIHESGESLELAGYGHGVDGQDKGAGKATTYALKYTLLYTFLVPTGQIDDTDTTHSKDIDSKPKPKQAPKKKSTKKVEYMTKEQFGKIKELHVSRGKVLQVTADTYGIKKFSELRKAQAVKLIEYLESLPEATLQ